MDASNLAGQAFLVTGAGGALGQDIVAILLERGATCHAVYSTAADAARRPTRDPREGLIAHAADLTNEDQVAALFGAINGLWASIHTVGAFSGGPIQGTTAAGFRKMLEVNAVTCFLCCREAVKAIRRSGPGGRIVNVGARPAVVPAGGMTAYAASKAAVVSITQCLADEVKPDGILVNAVLPSVMDTPANRAAMPGADYAKWPSTKQVGDVMVALASPGNVLTSGALIPVYGRA